MTYAMERWVRRSPATRCSPQFTTNLYRSIASTQNAESQTWYTLDSFCASFLAFSWQLCPCHQTMSSLNSTSPWCKLALPPAGSPHHWPRSGLLKPTQSSRPSPCGMLSPHGTPTTQSTPSLGLMRIPTRSNSPFLGNVAQETDLKLARSREDWHYCELISNNENAYKAPYFIFRTMRRFCRN